MDFFRIAFLVLFNVLLYGATVRYEPVMDDHQWYRARRQLGFTRLRDVKNRHELMALLAERLYSGTTFGTNLRVEHSFKIFLHAFICVLMYLALGRNEVSFFAAVLYACNPVNNQTSCWLNGRRYALNVILVLAMMAFPACSLALYPFSMFLQVTAFFSPVLLVGHSWWYLALIPAMLGLGWKQIRSKCETRSGVMSEGDLKTFKWTRLIVIIKTFGFFFWKMILPGVCAMQYPDRVRWGLTEEGNRDAYKIDGHFAAGCVAFAVCGWVVLHVPGQYRPLAAFMVLATLQWSAVMPITQILSDRYCSMPNVFMMFFVAYFAGKMGIMGAVLVCALGAYYCVCLSVVVPMYENLTEWYTYHFKYFPGLSWYRHNLIMDLMNEGQRDEALRQTIEGLNQDKKDFRLLMWGAIMSTVKGNLKEAESFLEEAGKNFYLNREEEQRGEIEHIRQQLAKLKPVYEKAEKLTQREKAAFLKGKGVRA